MGIVTWMDMNLLLPLNSLAPLNICFRTRQDTVRCIVSSLTDDSMGELADELNKAEPLVLDDSYQSDDDAENWELWKPDPVDANPGSLLSNTLLW